MQKPDSAGLQPTRTAQEQTLARKYTDAKLQPGTDWGVPVLGGKWEFYGGLGVLLLWQAAAERGRRGILLFFSANDISPRLKIFFKHLPIKFLSL